MNGLSDTVSERRFMSDQRPIRQVVRVIGIRGL